ncbi:SusC/RagA family TonB-linked outer membrane protein [Echinicola rosea]|nr:SusC/RagA family TonB-linked outer membrane protein [Echinicola rosea]
MKKSVQLALLLCMFLQYSFAQTTSVTGTVTSAESEEPVPGVSILVKGTSRGAVTDLDGKYSLEVPAGGEVLIFSFIGMTTQEVPINNRTVVDVAMASDAEELSEVVVTALGIERSKNELPYAAQSVEGEQLSETRDPNFINQLSGRVAGLNIKSSNNLGGSSNVVIRGSSSLTGNNQALFVIDGVPVDNSITNTNDQSTGRGGYDYGNAASDINPDDIASVNVLKGAAATALYGSRASNGVVVITTKKGSKGFGVTVNAGVTFGKIDKSTYAKYQNEYGAGYGSSFYNADLEGFDPNIPFYYYGDDASYGEAFDGRMVYDWKSVNPASEFYQQATPWQAARNTPVEFFESPVSTSTSILLNGGTDKGYYKLGYTRNDQEGILPNSRMKKNIVNFSGSYDIVEKLTATASINFSMNEGLGRYGTGYSGLNVNQSFRQWWPVNVDVKELESEYFATNGNATWNWSNETAQVPAYTDNPYWTRYENYQNDERIRTLGYMALNYEVTDWMDVMGRISLDTYSEIQEERIAVGSLDPSNYSRFNRNYKEFNYDLLMNFNKQINEDLDFKGLLGGNIRKTQINSIDASTNGGLVVPGLYSLSNSLNPMSPPTEVESTLQVNGVFAGATFTYRDYLILDGTVRRDQASSLAPENNTYYYPSVSGGFIFSEFLNNKEVFTFGKLRANYAEVSNTAAPQVLQDIYYKPTAFDDTPLFSMPSSKNNPDLLPERTKSFEIGAEMTFMDAAYGFDVTYYDTRTVDQIIPVTTSTATGFSSRYVNAGELQNAGWEISAFATPIQNQDFSWTINVNWTKNKSKVLSLNGENRNLELASLQGGVTLNAAVGEPYGTIRGRDFVIDTLSGQPMVDEDGRYMVTSESNNVIGDINPDWYGGINNSFSYKNISLSFLIDIQKGGEVFSLDRWYGDATGIYPETAGVNDLGNPKRDPVTNDETSGGIILPGVDANGDPNTTRLDISSFGELGYAPGTNPNSMYVYDASYVKLRNLSISYTFPRDFVDRIKGVQGIDLSLIGRNLWIIHKNMKYSDPEESLGAGNNQGYQSGAYPTTKTYGFNLRLKF